MKVFLGVLLTLVFAISCDKTQVTAPLLLVAADNDFASDDCNGREAAAILIGNDSNSNGDLEENEIVSKTTFCDDDNEDPILILVYHYGEGSTCDNSNGGYEVEFGYDLNRNGQFEVQQEFVSSFGIDCNININSFLINVKEIVRGGGVCGKEYRVEWGHDVNDDKMLSEDELDNFTSFYNRLAIEGSRISLTLNDNAYEQMALAFQDLNPEGAENLLVYKSFSFGLWTEEEVEGAIVSYLMEYGSKVDCQAYLVSFETFPAGLLTWFFGYDSQTGTYVR